MGKNVPENKKIGRIPSRMIIGKLRSESSLIEYPASGALNDATHSAAAGIARMPHADGTPPSSAATMRNAVAETAHRNVFHTTNPTYSSLGSIEVDTTPS